MTASASDPPQTGLRERTRRAVQAEVAEVAIRLFLEQGFEATTIDQVAAAVGLSRSSFFRHFATKEDAVLVRWERRGDEVLAALRARPLDEPVWTSLARAFDPVVAALAVDPARALALTRMIFDTPTLAARRSEKQYEWRDMLAPEVARRLTTRGAPAELQAQAVVAAALACLDTAYAAWGAADGDLSLPATMEAAMAAVASVVA